MSKIDLLLEAVDFVEKNEKGAANTKPTAPLSVPDNSHLRQVSHPSSQQQQKQPSPQHQSEEKTAATTPTTPRRPLVGFASVDTREVHNKLEKNRRAHLKECFERLKGILPYMDKKSSNLYILQNALKTVDELNKRNEELNAEKKDQEQRHQALLQRLTSLHPTENSTFSDLLNQQDSDSESTSTASECGAYTDSEDGGGKDHTCPVTICNNTHVITSSPPSPHEKPLVATLQEKNLTFQNAISPPQGHITNRIFPGTSLVSAASLSKDGSIYTTTAQKVGVQLAPANNLRFTAATGIFTPHGKCVKMVPRMAAATPATVTLVSPLVVTSSKPTLLLNQAPTALVKTFSPSPQPKAPSLVLPTVVNPAAINMSQHVSLKPLVGGHTLFPQFISPSSQSSPPVVVVTSTVAAATVSPPSK